MKCPSCGAEIGDNRSCSFCGTQISAEMLREKEILNKEGCPKCGSTNVNFNRENQGEVRGKNTKRIVHHTVGVCKDCGYTWRTDGSQPVQKRKTWLWVLGWIFIFPLPLTLILLKKKDMKPALKYGIIAAAWILFLLIGIFGGNKKDKTTDTDTNTSTVAAEEQHDVFTADRLKQYLRTVVLNENTDLPTEKYLYKLPAGTYIVTTTNEKFTVFFVVKDEIGTEDNPEYPEILQYVSGGYQLTAGDNDLNGSAKKSVTVTLREDESFQVVDNDTSIVFEKTGD